MNHPDEQVDLNKSKWDARAATFDDRCFDYFRCLQRRVVRLIEVKPGIHFLDVGCGTGWAVRHVAGLVQGRGEFHGADLSANMIAKARANSVDLVNVHFHQANAERLPLEGGTFDSIICTNSFHHYPDPFKALSEMARVLKVGGRVYIMDLTADGPLLRAIDRRVKAREKEHVKFYGTREYRQMFSVAGLRYVRSKTIAFPMKVHIGEK